MKRIPNIRTIGLLLVAAAFTQSCREKAPPNILVIVADDHCKQTITSYNPNSLVQTPGIDRLAEEGMQFHGMMVSNSVCAPSRAVMLTGKHSHVNGMKTNRHRFDGSQQTFPKLLQEAGYRTAVMGKWHLRSRPEGFDDYRLMDGQGQYYDCPLKDPGHPWDSTGNVFEGYLTDVITDQGIRWLEELPAEEPFCLLVHHKAPHGPHDPAPRHAHLWENDTLPEPPTLLDTYEGRAPEPIGDELVSSRLAISRYPGYREDIQKYAGDREKTTRHMYQVFMRGYLKLVKSLDENVERLLDYLDESGLAENTLVIYTSDNGFFNGEHGFYNKMWMYEPSMALPFIARWPGEIPGGSDTKTLTSLPDLTATILDAAGVDIPDDLQGTSLRPVFTNPDTALREAVYYHYYEAFHVPEQIGVRTTRYKLIFFPNLPESYRWELYDLQTDPREMENLYEHEALQPVRGKMHRLLEEKIDETGDQDAQMFLKNIRI